MASDFRSANRATAGLDLNNGQRRAQQLAGTEVQNQPVIGPLAPAALSQRVIHYAEGFGNVRRPAVERLRIRLAQKLFAAAT